MKELERKSRGDIRKRDLIKSLPTDKQLNAVWEAIDFIATNSDGASNVKYYTGLQRRLRTVWRKGIRLQQLVGKRFGYCRSKKYP